MCCDGQGLKAGPPPKEDSSIYRPRRREAARLKLLGRDKEAAKTASVVVTRISVWVIPVD